MMHDDLQSERRLLKNRVRRRGIYLLPNLFTTAALFAGFYAIVQAMNVNFDQAAIAIFVAMVLDGLDGRVARMTRTQSAFGAEFDSLADMVSFGAAPALVIYEWVLRDLGKLGWIAAFVYVAGAALRLARFNIQAASADKRYFVGMPSPAAAGILASTVYAYPEGLVQFRSSLPAILLVVVPALLMVSTVRFRSFKTIDLQARRPFRVLIFFAALLTVIATHPQSVLVVSSYGYLVSPLIETIVMRLRRKPAAPPAG